VISRVLFLVLLFFSLSGKSQSDTNLLCVKRSDLTKVQSFNSAEKVHYTWLIDADSNVHCEGRLKNDLETGFWKYNYRHGVHKAQGFYENGKKTGCWKFYHPKGALASIGEYENGLKTGYWKVYNQGEQLTEEGWYAQDKRDGWWKFYKAGKLAEEGSFAADKKIGYWRFYEYGMLTSVIIIEEE
jgi:antitoxin component YwqK of YwqJK toxin-antitoxin module